MVVGSTTAAATTPSDQEVRAFLDKWIDKIDLHGKLLNYVIRTETLACTVNAGIDWDHVFGETLTRVAKTDWNQYQIREAAFVLVRDELPFQFVPEELAGLNPVRVFEAINDSNDGRSSQPLPDTPH